MLFRSIRLPAAVEAVRSLSVGDEVLLSGHLTMSIGLPTHKRMVEEIAAGRELPVDLRGGAFVQGRILVAQRKDILQVPREALLNWDVEKQTAEVYVVNGAKAEKKKVTLGVTGSATVEVTSGLTAGEQVVTRGAFAIADDGRVLVAKGAGA